MKNHRMLLLSLVALAAAVALLGGLDTAVAADQARSRAVTVTTAQTDLGRILVNGRGRTLYLFEKDKHGKSACSGQCAGFWPPLLTSGKPLATAGARASLLGTTRRADGRLQVTYNHHPLYTFVKDTGKGQTNGEGFNNFGAGWDVLSPAGAKIEKTDATSGSGGGYGGGGYGP